MSAHLLLNSLNALRERDKIRGLQSVLSLFCNKLNKFNNTQHESYSIYGFYLSHKTTFLTTFFCVKMSRFCHLLRNIIMGVITLRTNL